ncbi:hypothetical protein BC826DRAFT_1006677 [Russula brevipes]|nr:hypothetical protein BC826DRAFT_1006677 [Russula brevipes]
MAVPGGREKVAIHIEGQTGEGKGREGKSLDPNAKGGRAARARGKHPVAVGGACAREGGLLSHSAKDEERVVMAPNLRLQLSRHRPRYCPDLYFPSNPMNPWTCLPFSGPVAPSKALPSFPVPSDLAVLSQQPFFPLSPVHAICRIMAHTPAHWRIQLERFSHTSKTFPSSSFQGGRAEWEGTCLSVQRAPAIATDTQS